MECYTFLPLDDKKTKKYPLHEISPDHVGEVYNLLGKKIHSLDAELESTALIDVSNFSNGVYLIRAHTTTGWQSSKVILAK